MWYKQLIYAVSVIDVNNPIESLKFEFNLIDFHLVVTSLMKSIKCYQIILMFIKSLELLWNSIIYIKSQYVVYKILFVFYEIFKIVIEFSIF